MEDTRNNSDTLVPVVKAVKAAIAPIDPTSVTNVIDMIVEDVKLFDEGVAEQLATSKRKVHVTLAVGSHRRWDTDRRNTGCALPTCIGVTYESELFVFYNNVSVRDRYLTHNERTDIKALRALLVDPYVHAIVLKVQRGTLSSSSFLELRSVQEQVVKTFTKKLEEERGIELVDPAKYRYHWTPHTTILDPVMMRVLRNHNSDGFLNIVAASLVKVIAFIEKNAIVATIDRLENIGRDDAGTYRH